MAGRKKKLRLSPFTTALMRTPAKTRPDEEQLLEEGMERMELLEHDAFTRDREYQKAFQQVVDKTSKRSKSAQKYTSGDKLRAALAYIITASSTKAEKLCGIKASTIARWKQRAPWWPKAVEYALLAKKEELDANLQQIQDLANVEVMDRIRNGDSKTVGKEGKMVKVPIGGKDLMFISTMAREKQALLRGEVTSLTSGKKSDADKLEDIANKITAAVKKSSKVIEGTVIKRSTSKEGEREDEGKKKT